MASALARGLTPRVEALADRVRLRFAFGVPEKLPPTGVDDASTIHWRVRVTGDVPGVVDLDARFEVPVERLLPARHSHFFVVSSGGAESRDLPELAKDLPPKVVVADLANDELRLRFAPGRTRGLSHLLLGASLLLFGLAGWFQWNHEPDTGQPLPLAFLAVLVAGIGLLALGASIGLGHNDLEVRLKQDWLMVERRRFGKASRQTVHRRQIASLRVGSFRLSESQDTRYGIYWLRARLAAGGGVTLADGVRGGAAFDAIVEVYEDWFGEAAEYV